MATELYRDRRDIKVSRQIDQRLEAFGLAIGEKRKNRTVERLLNIAGVNAALNTEKVQVATFENVLSEGAPIVIFGRPSSGKSFTLKKLARRFSENGINTIVIDVTNEHIELGKKMSASAAITRNFRAGHNYRVVPETDPRSRQLSISRLFEHLLMLAMKRKLKDFVVLIDEGNELVDVKELRDFLIESRKFVRKAIIVSADPTPYEKICVAMKPLEFKKDASGHVLGVTGEAKVSLRGDTEEVSNIGTANK